MLESGYKNNGFVNFIFEFVDFSKENTGFLIAGEKKSLLANPSRTQNQAKSGSGAPGPKSLDFYMELFKKIVHFSSAYQT